MIYKEYGRTGKNVSAVGFGGMRFNLEKSLEENAELLHYASDKGVNYFDTAPGYCDDKSEDIFGIAFKSMPRNKFFVSTKLMPMHVKNAQETDDKVRKSLERLNVDKIDFFHVWCLRKMEHYHDAMRPDGMYEALLRCQAEGLIEHIVFSSHQTGPGIRQVIETGNFAGVLMGINILNFPYRWDGVIAARENGLGVVAMNPLSGGLIPKNEDKLRFLASEGETPTEAALRFLIASPDITVALNGFTTTEHIDSACKAADNARPMTDAELERIKANISDNVTSICTTCGYCDSCPKNISIPSYMQIYNDRLIFGNTDEDMINSMNFQREWGLLAASKGHAKDCIACGLCEESCTQHLPIIARLNEMSSWEAEAANKK